MERGGGQGSDEAFMYPAEVGGQRMEITDGDMERLFPGIYLNDTLVNFTLRYMQREGFRGAMGGKMYVFGSYFYSMLTERTSDIDEAYQSVKKWTRKVNLFTKQFVFVPICAEAHWSLACIANLDKLQTGEGKEPEERPCIIFMDSLDYHNSTTIAGNLRSYLEKEWAKASRGDISLNEATLPLVLPNVPKQPNGYDCGVYVIRYFQEICQQCPRCTAREIVNALTDYFGSNMFTQDDIVQERVKLRDILYDCKKRYMAAEEARKQEGAAKADKTPIRPGWTDDQERRFRAALLGPFPAPLRRRRFLAATSPHPSTFKGGAGSKRPPSDVDAPLGKRKKDDSWDEVEVIESPRLVRRRAPSDKRTAPFSAYYSVTSSQVNASTLGDPNHPPTVAASHTDMGLSGPIMSGSIGPHDFESLVGGHTVRGIQGFPKSNTPVSLETPNLSDTAIADGAGSLAWPAMKISTIPSPLYSPRGGRGC